MECFERHQYPPSRPWILTVPAGHEGEVRLLPLISLIPISYSCDNFRLWIGAGLELHQLRYFAKAAQLGSFTKAAQASLVSQPSLSQQIAKLEQELGQPLFERVGRGAKLTEI